MTLLYFYIGFSYLFMLGGKMGNSKVPAWNVIFAPLTLPMCLGIFSSEILNSLNDLKNK